MKSKNDLVLHVMYLRLNRTKKFKLSIDELKVHEGEIACIAGANGSGKTTLLEIITGLIQPRSGGIYICGNNSTVDSKAFKRLIGYIPDDDNWIIPELTPREYFTMLISVYSDAGITHNMHRRLRLLAKQLLFDAYDIQMGALSHGNRKKVQIISALIHQPELLIVDELRNGLDPVVIKRAEALLKAESNNGTAVLAATHDLWWAERFADNIVMLKDGSMIYKASTTDICHDYGSVESKFMELYA